MRWLRVTTDDAVVRAELAPDALRELERVDAAVSALGAALDAVISPDLRRVLAVAASDVIREAGVSDGALGASNRER